MLTTRLATPEQRMELDRPDEITLRDVLGLIRRHRLLMALSLAACVGAAIAYAILATPVYEATTTIRVQPKAANLPEVFSATPTRDEDEVLTEVEELRSRSFAEHVVNELGLQASVTSPTAAPRAEVLADVALPPDAESEKYRLVRADDGRFTVAGDDDAGAAAPGEPIALAGGTITLAPGAAGFDEIGIEVQSLGDAIETLREEVRVGRTADEVNMIELHYRSRDPQLARAVLVAWTDQYMAGRKTLQTAEAKSLAGFLRVQLDTLTEELAAAEQSLRRFRVANQVLNPEVESTTQVEGYADMRAERDRIEAERSALAKVVRGVRAAPEPEPGTVTPSPYRRLVAFPSLLRAQATPELLRSLADVEQQETELLKRRTLQDPDVQELVRRQRNLEDQLRGIAETYLEGLTAHVTSLDAALVESGRRMEKIPAKEVEYARLRRAPEILTQMVTLLQTRLKEAQIAQAVDEPGMRVVDAAYASAKPVRPKPAIDLAFGILLGLLVGFGAAITREHLDRSLRTRNDVEAVTGTPVLGLIPRMTNGRAAALPGAAAQLPPSNGRPENGARPARFPSARAATLDPVMEESYTRLHLNVEALQPDGARRTMLLTSPLAGDGKTTTAVNLTRALWQRGYRALLIDADVRRGAVHRTFGTVRTPGLSDILMGEARLRDTIRNPSLDGRGIHYVTCGSRTNRPAEMLRSGRLAELLDEAKRMFDVIVLDSAPLNVVTDAAVIAPHVDSVILVARAGVTDPEALRFAMDQLRIVRAPVLGTVLNDIDPRRDASYDPTYRYLGFSDYAYFGAGS